MRLFIFYQKITNNQAKTCLIFQDPKNKCTGAFTHLQMVNIEDNFLSKPPFKTVVINEYLL